MKNSLTIKKQILFLKIDKEQYYILVSFLTFINKLPSVVTGIESGNIHTKDIPVKEEILKVLQQI